METLAIRTVINDHSDSARQVSESLVICIVAGRTRNHTRHRAQIPRSLIHQCLQGKVCVGQVSIWFVSVIELDMSRSYCLSATEQTMASEACFCLLDHTNELKTYVEAKLQYMSMNA